MRGALGALVVGAVVLLGGAAGAGSAFAQEATGANPDALVRLAHLSPDTPAVDVYLAQQGGPAPTVVRDVAYGAVSDYLALAPGSWTVDMRPAGAPATSAPVFDTSATVAAGDAYSVLVTGTGGTLTSTVTTDDLAPVPAGEARARVVQASPRAADATFQAVGGPLLAQDQAYGTASPYGTVPAGRWSVQVSEPGSTTPDVRTLDLAEGSVNTLVVVDNRSGGFDVLPVVDGAGVPAAQVPTGSVPAGFGGGALGLDSAGARWAAASLLVLVAGSLLAVRRLVLARS
ncbi:hypothetical protein GCM10027047_32180 [Rhodococcus aerolatus]